MNFLKWPDISGLHVFCQVRRKVAVYDKAKVK